MELFDSKIKKFLIFLEMKPCTFSAQPRNLKKCTPKKISYTLGNENPEKIPYISGNFLYFRK